MEQNEQTN